MADFIAGVTIEINGTPATISAAEQQADHAVINYTITPAVQAGDVVTLDYNKASGHIVAESGGEPLGVVSAQTVTNNVTGDDEPMQATATLTHSDIIALPTVPFVIVPAPGDGKINVFLTAAVVSDVTHGAYENITEEGGTAPYMYIGLSDETRISDSMYIVTLLTENSAVQYAQFSVGHDNDTPVGIILPTNDADLSVYENAAIALCAPNGLSGNFTAGNAANTIRITVFYNQISV